MIDELKRLTETGALTRWKWKLVVLTVVNEFFTAPHHATDVNNFAGATKWGGVWHTVESFNYLWARGANA